MRHGVTFQEVYEAADTLQEQGVNPTIDRVRDFLGGTGSNSTISKHLNSWRQEKDGKGDKAITPPDRVQAAVASVWQQIREQTNLEIEQIKEECSQQIELAQKQADAALAEKQKIEQEFQSLQQSYYAISADKEILTLDLNKLREEHRLINERYTGLEARHTELQQNSARQLAFASDMHQKEISGLQQAQEELNKSHQALVDEIKVQAEQQRHSQLMIIEKLNTDKQKQEKYIKELELKTQTAQQKIIEITAELNIAVSERASARNHLNDLVEKWQVLDDKMFAFTTYLQTPSWIPEIYSVINEGKNTIAEQINSKFAALNKQINQLTKALEMQDA